MIMIGMTVIVIMPMVWMTQWMNLTRIGKYGRQIVKKRSRNDIILDRIRKQDTEKYDIDEGVRNERPEII